MYTIAWHTESTALKNYKIDHIRLDYLKCIHFEQSMPVVAAARPSDERFPLTIEKHRCELCDQNLKQKVNSRHIRTFAWKCSLITQTMHTYWSYCSMRYTVPHWIEPVDTREREKKRSVQRQEGWTDASDQRSSVDSMAEPWTDLFIAGNVDAAADAERHDDAIITWIVQISCGSVKMVALM